MKNQDQLSNYAADTILPNATRPQLTWLLMEIYQNLEPDDQAGMLAMAERLIEERRQNDRI